MPEETAVSNASNAAEQEEVRAESPQELALRADFERFLAMTADIPAEQIKECHANAQVVSRNVRKGLAEITKPEIAARIARELPTIDLGKLIDELTRMADSLIYATRLVNERPPKKRHYFIKRTRASSLRRRLLTQLEMLADEGSIEQEELAPFRHDLKGNFGLVEDLLCAVEIFDRHEKEISDLITLEPELIAEARDVGQFLRAHLPPSRRATSRFRELGAAAEKRDRIWVLLNRRHLELRRVAAWLWLKEGDAHVPPLGGRLGTSKRAGRAEDEDTLAVA
jgi:hypothetical protein